MSRRRIAPGELVGGGGKSTHQSVGQACCSGPAGPDELDRLAHGRVARRVSEQDFVGT